MPAIGLLAGAAVVYQASYSAFSATTVNPTNNWTAGAVALSDDDSNSAMFTVAAANLKPGSSGSKCIVVSSTGSLPSAVRLYSTASVYAQTNGLGDNIALTITEGSGGGFAGGCSAFTAASSNSNVFSGTLTSFNTAGTAYGSSVASNVSWTPTGSGTETKTFKFDWSLPTNAPSSTQSGTAAIGFTWETQNS